MFCKSASYNIFEKQLKEKEKEKETCVKSKKRQIQKGPNNNTPATLQRTDKIQPLFFVVVLFIGIGILFYFVFVFVFCF